MGEVQFVPTQLHCWVGTDGIPPTKQVILHGQNLLALKFEMSHSIFCLHETCIASETIEGCLNRFLSFNALWNGSCTTKTPSLEVGDGGYRKRPPSFSWYGGSCSSKIVLTVSLSSSSLTIPELGQTCTYTRCRRS